MPTLSRGSRPQIVTEQVKRTLMREATKRNGWIYIDIMWHFHCTQVDSMVATGCSRANERHYTCTNFSLFLVHFLPLCLLCLRLLRTGTLWKPCFVWLMFSKCQPVSTVPSITSTDWSKTDTQRLRPLDTLTTTTTTATTTTTVKSTTAPPADCSHRLLCFSQGWQAHRGERRCPEAWADKASLQEPYRTGTIGMLENVRRSLCML